MDTARHSISASQALHKGEAIFSLNGKYKAVFEKDGDFVLYEWKSVWTSNTRQYNGDCIIMEDDGTLGIYLSGQKVSTIGQTQPKSGKMRLSVTDNGRLTITDAAKPIWQEP